MYLTFPEVGVFYTYQTDGFEIIEKAFGNAYKRRIVSQSAGAWTFAPDCLHTVDQRLLKQACSETQSLSLCLSKH